MKRRLALAVMFAWSLPLYDLQGQGAKRPQMTREEFEAKLGYQTGTVPLPGGIATIRLPSSFRFIGVEGSRRLLVQAWGNPPGAADGVLGMLIPTSASPLSEAGWGIVMTYDEDGYINDRDAATIDYSKLLKEMQEATTAGNDERRKQGFQSISLVGWAEPPHYDQNAHKVYWAKDLVFGSNPQHTLNYNMRILGRRGVLVLNAVAGMDQLSAIRRAAPDVLSAVEFNEGHRYADYLPGKDKAATYGVAGLILGAVAAKAGLFKLLWVGLLAFKKLIIVAAVAVAAFVRRLLGKKPQQPTTAGPGSL